MPRSPAQRPSRDPEAPPRLASGLAIVAIFAINLVILGYAVHVTRPRDDGPTVEGAAERRGAGAPGESPFDPTRPVAHAAHAPMIPGAAGLGPLTLAQEGAVLMAAANCAACHEQTETPPLPVKSAPDLTHVGSRVTPAFLRAFIADPRGAQPGTTMPDVLGARSADERTTIAESIARFLERGSPPLARSSSSAADRAAGRTLFHTVGCVACHPARDDAGTEIPAPDAIGLTHVAAKYSRPALTAFLVDPLAVRPAGRMPGMELTTDEARAIADYLVGASTPRDATETRAPGAALASGAAGGRADFVRLGCARCHLHEAVDAASAAGTPIPLDRADPSAGCLSTPPGSAPDYGFSDHQRAALRAALTDTRPPGDAEAARLVMVAFNCLACHERDGAGGVRDHRDAYFTSSEPSLGDAARLPPPLTGVGAKMRDDWMRRVLFDGASARSYLGARMPQFGAANLRGLPELLARVDGASNAAPPTPEGEEERTLRDAGRALVGEGGLNCITCHDFKGLPATGFRGIDLVIAAERLRPAWFHDFLLAPGAHRPGITMPEYWPDGVAVRRDILDGDTEAQLRALWHYLALGQSAREPEGMRPEPARLVVTDETRTYRGRSAVAGFRGIAVGYPGGLNFAFDAQNGALAALWSGAFVTVNWNGQGAGDFAPAAPPIELTRDVAFLAAPSAPDPWPLRPRTTPEQPVNPDPTYPRPYGYRFDGYDLDAASIPTLRYRCGDVHIADHAIAETDGDGPRLVRTLQFAASAPTTLWFRALVGSITPSGDGQFAVGGLRLQAPVDDSATPLLRAFSSADAGAETAQELLLRLEIPDGTTTITIAYELLR